jgi:hypothetical protein
MALRPPVLFSFIFVTLVLIFVAATTGQALQKSTLGTVESPPAEQSNPEQQPAAGEKAPAAREHQPAVPTQPPAPKAQPHAGTPQPEALPRALQEEPGAKHAPAPGAAGHEEAQNEEKHVHLPEISPIPGVTFVDTLIKLMDYELNVRTLGWRPNDIIIGRFTDNINNYQLGVLEAVRFTTLRLKDSLTRLGEADSYDPDLEQAVNLFMNSATSWWFPSAESSYSKAIEHLKKFKTKLEKGQRNFYYRRDTLVSLLATYKDLAGNVNRTLVMPTGWFQAVDYFYYAKGQAHVYFELLKVCRVGFKNQLATMHGTDIMDDALHELSIADRIEPWIVFNSDLDGFFANHRANLNAPLSEAAHLLGELSLL